MSTIKIRLAELEQMAKVRRSGDLWIEMKNNIVRVDRQKRGKERVFDSVYQAARWLEKELDEAPGAVGSVIVTDLTDVFTDSDQLRAEIAPLIGQVDLGACLFGHLKTEGEAGPADVSLWLLASKLYELRLFELTGQELTQDQINILTGFYKVYIWDREPASISGFLELVRQAGDIHKYAE